MEDILKIILQAEISNQSEENIRDTLEKIKEEFAKMQIQVNVGGGGLDDLKKLSTNLEALNKKIMDLEKDRQEQLKKSTKMYNDTYKSNEVAIQQAIDATDKLHRKERDLAKSRLKINRAGEFVSHSEQRGTRLKRTKVTIDDTGLVQDLTTVKDYEGLEKAKEKWNDFARSLQRNANITTKEIEEFKQQVFNLNLNDKGFNDAFKEATVLAKRLKEEDEARNALKKEQIKLEQQLAKIREGSYHAPSVSVFDKEIKKLTDFSELEKQNRKEDIDYLAVKEQRLKVIRELAEKNAESAKRHTAKAEAQTDFYSKADKLDQAGFNTATIRQQIKGIKVGTLEQDIENLEQSFVNLFKQTKGFQALEKQLDKLSHKAFDPFKGLKDTGNIDKMSKQLTALMHTLNDSKNRGIELSDKENQFLQEEVQSLQRALALYQGVEKEQEKQEKNLARQLKGFESLENQLAKLSHKAFDPFKGLKNINDAEEMSKQLTSLFDVINNHKERGILLDEKDLQLLRQQAEAVKRSLDARKQEEREQIRQRNLGTKVDPMWNEASQGAFNRDLAWNVREEEIRRLASSFLSVQYGIKNVDESLIKVNRSVNATGQDIVRLSYDIQKTNGEVHRYKLNLDEATRSMYDFGKSVNVSQSARNQSIWSQLENALVKIPVWASGMAVIYGGMNQLTQSFTMIYELDQAMTDLRKVVTETDAELQNFLDTAGEMSIELGMLTKDVVVATTEFARMGYNLQQSQGLAQNALLYANVGDMPIEDATRNLVSTLQGFSVNAKHAVEETARYADMFNEVSNEFPISSAGIGEALRRSSAILKEAGNDVEQSVAMVTAANSAIQDPARVGTAMKTVAMRLRGVSEEGENLSHLMPTLNKMFEDVNITLTKAGDPNTFKSTFEIFDELAEVWDGLDDVKQARLVEAIGGKEQGAIVAAMINNWKSAEGALRTAQESAGSATREFAKQQESMAFKVDRLRALMEHFWETFWNTEAIKVAVDSISLLVTGLTKFIEVFGSLPAVMGAATLVFMLFNKDLRETMFSVSDDKKYAGIGDYLSSSLDRAKESAIGFGQALRAAFAPMAIVMGASLALDLIIQKMVKVGEENKKLNEEAREEYKKTQDYLKSFDPEEAGGIDLDRYKQLEELSGSQSFTNEQLAEYTRMQKEITQLSPMLIDHYDEQGNAVAKSAEQIERLNEAKREEMRLQLETVIETDRKRYGEGDTMWNRRDADLFGPGLAPGAMLLGKMGVEKFQTEFEQIDEIKNKYRKEKDELKQIQQEMKAINLISSLLDDPNVDVHSREFEDKVAKVHRTIIDQMDTGKIRGEFLSDNAELIEAVMNGNKEAAENIMKDTVKSLEKQQDTMDKQMKKSQATLTKDASSFVETIDHTRELIKNTEDYDENEELFIDKLTENYKDGLGDFKGTTAEYEASYQETIEKIMDLADKTDIPFNEFVQGGGTERARAELQKFIDSLKGHPKVVALLKEYLAQLNNELNNTANNAAAFDPDIYWEDTTNVLGEYIDTIGEIDSIEKDLAENKHLSIQQMYKMIMKYPELSGYLKKEGDYLTLNAEGVQKLRELNLLKFNEEMSQRKMNLRAEAEATKQRLANYIKIGQAVDLVAQIQEQGATAAMTQYINEWREDKLAELERRRGTKGFTFAQWRAEYESEYAYLTGQGMEQFSAIGSTAKYINALEQLQATVGTGDFANNWTGGAVAPEKPEKEAKKYIYVTDLYQQSVRDLNAELRENNKLKGDASKYSATYQAALKREIEITKKRIDLAKKERDLLRLQIVTGHPVKTGLVSEEDFAEYAPPSGGTSYGATYTPTAGGGGGATTGGGGATTGPTPTLRVGSRGDSVKEVQRRLGIPADGIFGNQTLNAVRNFQRSKGLTADGIVGAQTWAALRGTMAVSGNAMSGGGSNPASYLLGFRQTSQYGMRGSSMHKGLDLGMPVGTPIQSLMSGTVARKGYQASGAGNYIVIKDDSGGEQKYFHMQNQSSLAVGTRVNAGQIIGHSGNTGDSSGPHLHVEIWRGGQAVNPLPIMQQMAGGAVGGGATGGGGTPTLRKGARGEAVKQLQRALGISADGIFGNQTEQAVRNFQRSRGLTADGIVGARTWSALYGIGGGEEEHEHEHEHGEHGLEPVSTEEFGIGGGSEYSGAYASDINRYANQYGLDPYLLASVIKAESNFNPNAVSHAGAQGLMQLMPGTARELGLTGNAVFNPSRNIEAGARYLAQQIKATGSTQLGLAAYNAGLGNVRKYGGIPPFAETQNYVRKVGQYYAQYTGGGLGTATVRATGGGGGGTPTLKIGSRGTAVQELQRALGISADGIFGNQTLNAVKNFQRSRGLTADGIVGSRTWAALRGGGGGGATTNVNRPTLRVGSRGDAVKELQRALGISADGIFGNQTANAVRNFQRSKGLTADAIVGAQTWSALLGGGGGGGATATNKPTLKLGSRGDAVKELQRALGITADGIFGNQTLAAVKKFQASRGLAADGIVGAKTWSALLGGGTTAPKPATPGPAPTTPKPTTPSDIQLPANYNVPDPYPNLDKINPEKRDVVEGVIDEHEQMTDEIYQMEDELQQMYVDLYTNMAAKWDWETDKLKENIAADEYRAGRVEEETQAWRDIQQRIFDFTKQTRDNNEKSMQELLKALADPNLTTQAKEDIEGQIRERQVQDLEFLKQMDDLRKGILVSEQNEIQKRIDDTWNGLTDRMNDIRDATGRVDEKDHQADYVNLLKQRLALQKEQEKIAKENIATLTAQQDKLREFPDLLEENEQKVKDWNQEIKNTANEQFETNEDIKNVYEQIADSVIEQYKKIYQERADVARKNLEEINEAEQEAYQKRLEQYDDDLNAYSKYIQDKLTALDEAESQRDYTMERDRLTEERQKIIDQIALYSMDSTVEGKTKLRELQDQLKEANQAFEEFQHDRGVSERRKALEEELQKRQEETDKLRETETERYEKLQEQRTKEAEELDKYWENIIENNENFLKLRREILAGNFTQVQEDFMRFMGIITTNSEQIGDSIANNINRELQETMNMLQAMDLMEEGQQWTNVDMTPTGDFQSFDTGGYTGEWGSDGKMAILHQKELILNKFDTAKILKAVELVRNLSLNLPKLSLPNLAALAGGNTINVSFSIDKLMGGESGAKELLRLFSEGLTRKGVQL